MTPEFTILMPCLNESETLAASISEANKYAAHLGLSYEILIADNGSADNSREIAEKSGARVITVPEKGYGNALRGGISAAKGKYIIMADCDMSYNFANIKEIAEKLRNGADLVMGNRFKGTIEQGAMPFSHRYFGIPLLSLAGRLRFKTDVEDFHCGIRGFDRKKAIALNLKCTGMEFATEIIARFAMAGYKITEVPADLRRDGRSGHSHLRSIRDGLRHLIFILTCKK